MDYTFSDEYARFIMPTVKEIEEGRKIDSMSETEREIYYLYHQMLDGKIQRYFENTGNHTCYEDAVDCVLFWAVQENKITEKESDRLYNKYVS